MIQHIQLYVTGKVRSAALVAEQSLDSPVFVLDLQRAFSI
jgi:hypothetical protein